MALIGNFDDLAVGDVVALFRIEEAALVEPFAEPFILRAFWDSAPFTCEYDSSTP